MLLADTRVLNAWRPISSYELPHLDFVNSSSRLDIRSWGSSGAGMTVRIVWF